MRLQELARVLNRRTLLAALYLSLRYYAAYILFSYGFAKVMGAQFTVLDSELAKPMGDVSGFWLTWYYFGYTPVYASIVAWTQIGGAALLCFRRTALIGAVVLLPVMVNIVGIDLWVIRFPVSSGALQNALRVLLALIVLLFFHARDISGFLRERQNDFALFARPRAWIVALQVAIVAAMLGYAAHEAYWLANVNNRAPTPIDGAWHVTRVQPQTTGLPDWMYFEYNRAFMVVLVYPDGRSETHDFRVDAGTNTLIMSKEWLTPGSDIFKGTWHRNGDTLEVRGAWGNTAPVEMTLQRKQEHIKDHN